MYVLDNTYTSLVAFIMGYQNALLHRDGYDISNQFQDWLRLKCNNHFSVHWSSYVLTVISKDDEEKAKSDLLDLLYEFVTDTK
ncbi:hypothetical protein FUAX_54810 (plasmid) [Fulvitalea axinellae]|uniref:Uncharacterized protein n=1 Tax=Fulvitalea axinellae TaxID=1182444 RepID=A0AAU9CM57_9BACT|nr:hypothetical protein FUAX_54810 [Fulvitalea axinellae]